MINIVSEEMDHLERTIRRLAGEKIFEESPAVKPIEVGLPPEAPPEKKQKSVLLVCQGPSLEKEIQGVYRQNGISVLAAHADTEDSARSALKESAFDIVILPGIKYSDKVVQLQVSGSPFEKKDLPKLNAGEQREILGRLVGATNAVSLDGYQLCFAALGIQRNYQNASPQVYIVDSALDEHRARCVGAAAGFYTLKSLTEYLAEIEARKKEKLSPGAEPKTRKTASIQIPEEVKASKNIALSSDSP